MELAQGGEVPGEKVHSGVPHHVAHGQNMDVHHMGLLKMRGISCEAIHGDIPQRERERTLQKFALVFRAMSRIFTDSVTEAISV